MRICQPVRGGRTAHAFTLVEIAVALAISVLVMAGMFKGHTMALQQMESIVAATWEISGTSVTNIFSPTLTNTQVNALCLPSSGTNLVFATNYATVQQISTYPPYVMVQVSCVWSFMDMGTFTNTVGVLRSPDL